jgi:hypothetical protein
LPYVRSALANATTEANRENAEQQRRRISEHVRGLGDDAIEFARIRHRFDDGEREQHHQRAPQSLFTRVMRVREVCVMVVAVCVPVVRGS